MARTGCAFAAVTCLCCPARTHRDRQVLPAYGLQDLPIKTQNPSRGSKPNTMWLPITLGESLGRGHFYLAETRTFLLCVDSPAPDSGELQVADAPLARQSSASSGSPARLGGTARRARTRRPSQDIHLAFIVLLHGPSRLVLPGWAWLKVESWRPLLGTYKRSMKMCSRTT